MGSQWTSKYNIMRDLSMVQGRVPADIDNTLTSGDKPPAVTLTEGMYCPNGRREKSLETFYLSK